MARASRCVSRALGILACLAAACVAAQGQQVYRYVDTDGRIVYSDHAPPSSATNVQIKKLGQNLIEIVPVNLLLVVLESFAGLQGDIIHDGWRSRG